MVMSIEQGKQVMMPGKKTGGRESSIIIFTSAKGGSGCSFLAQTIAVYMTRRTTLDVLLLDMNPGRMESRIVFELDRPGIKDLGHLVARLKDTGKFFLKEFVFNMEDSLNIILPPAGVDDLSIFEPESLGLLIETVRDHFDIICIDIPGHLFGSLDLPGTDISDRIVFVSLPDLFSVNNIRILMDHIKIFRSDFDFYLVINKYNKKPAISPAGMANIIQYPITSFIPYDRDIEELLIARGPGHIFDYSLKVIRNISGLAKKILEGLGL